MCIKPWRSKHAIQVQQQGSHPRASERGARGRVTVDSRANSWRQREQAAWAPMATPDLAREQEPENIGLWHFVCKGVLCTRVLRVVECYTPYFILSKGFFP